MSTDWNAIRAEFPALANWTFLNTATFGQLPRRAVDAIHRHLAHRDELACADFLSWFDDADRLRERVAQLVHCEAADVAFLNSANSALSLLMNGLDWKPDDRIVTLADEFPNNIYHPALLERRGVEFVETPWERFYDAITSLTRLVLISSVSYITGFAPPLEEMARFLRERGVLFCVDGTQSVGARRFDVARIQPDMLVVHGYKWLLCPNGIGFMYVSPQLRERLAPTAIGWRSHHGWRNVDNLHHGAPVFAQSAEKYEGGMLASALLCAMEASVGMLLEIGVDNIDRRVRELSAATRQCLRGLGAQVPDFDSAVVSARFEGHDGSALARELKQRRVLVSARHGNLRVSPHFYNTEEDLARLAAELRLMGV